MNIQALASTSKHWCWCNWHFKCLRHRHHYHPTSSPSSHTHTHSLYPSFKRSENLHSPVNWAHYTRLYGRFYLTVNVRLSSIERFEITWWWWCPCSNGKYDFNFCMFFFHLFPLFFGSFILFTTYLCYLCPSKSVKLTDRISYRQHSIFLRKKKERS